jgi:tetratricopeptide (TPR) repeat protein
MRLAAATACALLAACASRAPAPPAPTQATAVQPTAAMEANRRAENSLRRGELEGAVRHYREALRLSLAVEDAEGIAANAVNLSIVYQRQGKYDEARASLAPLLERATLEHTRQRRAQAALRRAVLDLDEQRYASAAEWAARATDWCGASCALAGPIRNVQGQLALAAGRLEEAAAAAQSALAASRAAAEPAEVANAQRLRGMTALAAGDGAAALEALGEALAIDREIGIPRRIFLDLVGLGGASKMLGDRRAARGYYARARAVSEADRDAAGSAEARALFDDLDLPDRK